MEGILTIHQRSGIKYKLSDDRDSVFECIMDKLNDQYNLKYTTASQISAS